MRLMLSAATLAAAGLFLLNAAFYAAPSAAQTLSQPAITAATPNKIEAPVDPVAAPAEANPASVASETPPQSTASLPVLVADHMNTEMSDEEGKCLAVAVYFESKGEPLAGQLAVAQVMLNRTQSGRFPETVCGVIRQPGQFSFVHHGQFPAIAESSRAWHTALAISQIARDKLWQPVVGHAMFFHAKRVSPHWHAVQVAALGNHIFYR